MERQFDSQVAIVTGAGQGIGLEICKQLAAQGAKVVLNDLDATLARDGAAAVQEYGQCVALHGDASDSSFINRMVETAVGKFGRLDIVVANAGITLFGAFLDYTRADFMKVIELNLAGSFFLAQAASKQIIKQKSGGSILLMSSVTGHQAHKNLAAYGMTKAALEMLARNLVIELSPYKININAVAPGATKTERTLQDPTYDSTWQKLTPMGRPGTPADIAAAVCFLVSPAARHITGQSLVVDGGWSSVSPNPE